MRSLSEKRRLLRERERERERAPSFGVLFLLLFGANPRFQVTPARMVEFSARKWKDELYGFERTSKVLSRDPERLRDRSSVREIEREEEAEEREPQRRPTRARDRQRERESDREREKR